MRGRLYLLLFIFMLILSTRLYAASPFQVALTLDDMPVVGVRAGDDANITLDLVIQALRKNDIVGVYGFVNGKKAMDDPVGKELLKKWISAGHYKCS